MLDFTGSKYRAKAQPKIEEAIGEIRLYVASYSRPSRDALNLSQIMNR